VVAVTLTEHEIRTLPGHELFAHLRGLMEMQLEEATGYNYTPGPQHWFMPLDEDSWSDCDIGVRDCGSPGRGAKFVAALMYAAGLRGLQAGVLCLQVKTPLERSVELELKDEGHRVIRESRYRGFVRGTTEHGIVEDEYPEYALLRAYLLHAIREEQA
jgi:hypothetical protein